MRSNSTDSETEMTDTAMNVTDLFMRYIWEKSEKTLPEQVVRQAKKCLIDYIGVTFAGAARTNPAMTQYMCCTSENGKCSVIGTGRKADAVTAAFVNGFNAHVLELDDGHRYGMIHLAAPVISAAIAAAENENAGGERLIQGIVIGYEAAVRLSVAIQPAHKKAGFHTAGTCGTIGAAVGAGIILGLDIDQLKAAVSAAGTSAAGLLEIQENASELKPYNTGHAAMSGLNAAYVGRAGFCGPNDILGGPRGMVTVLASGADVEKMTNQQAYYEIEKVYFKPYAACRHCHSAIEAAMKLRKETELTVEEIEAVTVYTYQLAVKGHDHTRIEGVPSAKLSIPFCVAAAYLMSDSNPVEFTEKNVTDKQLLTLTGKVHVAESEEFTEMSPARRIAEVVITDTEGKKYSRRIDYAKGDPENPMSEDEIRNKFYQLMEMSGNQNRSNAILDTVYDIADGASELYKLLS